MTTYILASRSPRRQSLLRNLIKNFIVVESEVKEEVLPGEEPADFAIRIAEEKALSVGKRIEDMEHKSIVVIAADTIVVDDSRLIGKPANADQARAILLRLRGKTHQVLSGITLYQPEESKLDSHLVTTDVTMREYSDREIQDYIDSGDPFDKAGAYAIQNEFFNPAPAFRDCYANVMGLPLCHLYNMMEELKLDVLDGVADRCQDSINYICPVYTQILSGTYKNMREPKI